MIAKDYKCEVEGCMRQARHLIKTEAGLILPICEMHFEMIKKEELEVKLRMDREKESNDSMEMTEHVEIDNDDYMEGLTNDRF